MVTGWIDSSLKNYPCRRSEDFPKDQRGICLEPEMVEIIFSYLERHVSDATIIWSQAMNQRINSTEIIPISEVYRIAYEQGIKTEELPTIPE